MADNNSEVAKLTVSVGDAVAAIRDLASKVAAGQDVSAQLTALAAQLNVAVSEAGEPVTPSA